MSKAEVVKDLINSYVKSEEQMIWCAETIEYFSHSLTKEELKEVLKVTPPGMVRFQLIQLLHKFELDLDEKGE